MEYVFMFPYTLCVLNNFGVNVFQLFYVSYIVRSFFCVYFSSPELSSDISIVFYCSLSHWYLYVFNVLLNCYSFIYIIWEKNNLNLNLN